MSDKYQVMPPLSEEEYQALKADIATHGVLVPVELDEEGSILDGYHRGRACEELGIKDWPTVTRPCLTEEEKRTHARRLNLIRRHLSQEQKRELIRQQLKSTPEKSDRQIAAMLGVSHPTVSVIRYELEEAGEVVNFTTSIGADGKKYSRQQKAVAIDDPAFELALKISRESLEVLRKKLDEANTFQELLEIRNEAAAWQQLWAESRLRCERVLGELLAVEAA